MASAMVVIVVGVGVVVRLFLLAHSLNVCELFDPGFNHIPFL